MKRKKRRGIPALLVTAGILFGSCIHGMAETNDNYVWPEEMVPGRAAVQETASRRAALPESGSQENVSRETDALWDLADQYLNLHGLDEQMADVLGLEEFSVREMVYAFLKGEWKPGAEEIFDRIREVFLGELIFLKRHLIRILVVILAGAIFSNFVRVFENSQIADISFYMIYILVSSLLVNSFSVMDQMTVQACEAILKFIKVLLPSYLITVVLGSGTITALGFYEITVLALNAFQILILKVLIPGIHLYLILMILNQLASDDFFSKAAQLVELLVDWTLRTLLGAVIGLQTVQCLTAPAVDSFKNSALQRMARVIPGIGGALDAACETVAGSALLLKNAVGVAGILALGLICLTPVMKLAAAILMFRIMGALVQPVSEKRLIECMDSVSKGAILLMRVLIAGMSVFIISIAMVTASSGGG